MTCTSAVTATATSLLYDETQVCKGEEKEMASHSLLCFIFGLRHPFGVHYRNVSIVASTEAEGLGVGTQPEGQQRFSLKC